MVIDSSVLVAILQDEPERPQFLGLVGNDPVRKISTASIVETSIVILGRR